VTEPGTSKNRHHPAINSRRFSSPNAKARTRIRTYRYAYQPGSITLCEHCASDPAVIARVGTLGECQHGLHDDICETEMRRAGYLD